MMKGRGMLLYLLAVLIPPLGILVYGKITQAALNALLWSYAFMTPGIWGVGLWLVASTHSAYIIRDCRFGNSC